MLAELAKSYPQLILENATRLKECLDYFTFLHSASASSLVRAISPLFHLSQDLLVSRSYASVGFHGLGMSVTV